MWKLKEFICSADPQFSSRKHNEPRTPVNCDDLRDSSKKLMWILIVSYYLSHVHVEHFITSKETRVTIDYIEALLYGYLKNQGSRMKNFSSSSENRITSVETKWTFRRESWKTSGALWSTLPIHTMKSFRKFCRKSEATFRNLELQWNLGNAETT